MAALGFNADSLPDPPASKYHLKYGKCPRINHRPNDMWEGPGPVSWKEFRKEKTLKKKPLPKTGEALTAASSQSAFYRMRDLLTLNKVSSLLGRALLHQVFFSLRLGPFLPRLITVIIEFYKIPLHFSLRTSRVGRAKLISF